MKNQYLVWNSIPNKERLRAFYLSLLLCKHCVRNVKSCQRKKCSWIRLRANMHKLTNSPNNLVKVEQTMIWGYNDFVTDANSFRLLKQTVCCLNYSECNDTLWRLKKTPLNKKAVSKSTKQIYKFGTRKAEVLNSLIINTTAKANDTTDILQTFR